MIHLPALSIGHGVPPPGFEAELHSVFPKVINLKPAGASRLLTLLALDQADLPQGIRLDTPRGFSFDSFSPGTRAICREGELVVADRLTVDLRGAQPWECNLAALVADLSKPTVQCAWREVFDLLNARGRYHGAAPVASDLMDGGKGESSALVRETRAAVSNLLEATRGLDAKLLKQPLPLIGLGPGLTPSGDDLLVGYLAGLWCSAGGQPKRMEFISALGQKVIEDSQGTNDISRTYLYHAVNGQVSSRLAELAEAVCTGEKLSRVLVRAEAAMRTGHSSGMEAVTGLLLGLGAWEDIPIIEIFKLKGGISIISTDHT